MQSLAKRIFVLIGVLFAAVGINEARAAQIALVDQDFGHALLFNHNGNCFALMPSHVARGQRVTLEMPVQRLLGSGTIFLRHDANDLAIAEVSGDIVRSCTDPWNAIGRNLTPLLEKAPRGEIVRVGPEGYLDRTEAVIIEFDPDTVFVSTTDEWAPGAIQQGTSGAALEIGGVLVGIAQKSPDQRRARFFRVDRIAELAAPYMAAPNPAASAIPGTRQDGTKGFRITAWDGTGSGADNAAALERGLLGEAYVAAFSGKPLSIEITLHGQKPVPVRELRITSGPKMPQTQSPPRTIALEADVGAPGAPYWRKLGVRDMPPSGVLSFSTGGAFARRLRLSILSVWVKGRSVRIDGLAVE